MSASPGWLLAAMYGWLPVMGIMLVASVPVVAIPDDAVDAGNFRSGEANAAGSVQTA
ncbi:MAG: hypothetical protein QGG46_09895 [Gammaproteobacteria bacterium]|jgi:hypothetical protein|nr:hypothetical protein [Gammaproteobacteria bacterium]